MSFTGLPLVLDEWLNIGGGRACNLTAAKAFSIQPLDDEQGEAGPPMDNLWAWYKADAQSYSNGARVTLVNDSGPNGYHLNDNGNPPGSEEPFFFTNILNGLPIFRWPSGDAIFRTVTGFNAAGFSLAVVHRKVIQFAGNTVIASANAVHHIANVNAGASQITYLGRGNATTVSLTVPINTWQIVSVTFDETEGIPRLKTNLLSGEGSVGSGGANLDQPFLQGRALDEMAECLIYSIKLADDKLHQLRSYLAVKYAIGII